MKLDKSLFINKKPVHLVSEDIRLNLYAPGAAIFQVKAKEPLSGSVTFAVGYSHKKKSVLYFTGYIEKSNTVDDAQQRIICKELGAMLEYRMPCALRHPTLHDVLQWYTGKTGLTFITADQPYAATRVPHFCTTGTGFNGMANIGKVFNIPRYIWQCQPDGSIWVGSRDHSRWKTLPVELDEAFFSKTTADGAKEIAVIPQLRPGVEINGQYISRLQLTGSKMVAKCSTRLKK
ncbi:MAG: hypothetical protein ACNI27_11215 [Desulfovibrio sp.]